MSEEKNSTYSTAARNTFVAIGFRSSHRRLKRGDVFDVVSVDGGVVGSVKTFAVHLFAGGTRSGLRDSLNKVFKEIKILIANRNVPVVGWGVETGKRLCSLIEMNDIDIEYPIRYFDLQYSALRKMGATTAKQWQTVAAKLNVETTGRLSPSAIDCARIHLALEKIDYRLVVARAFVTFIKSIMYDPDTPDAIDTAEAKGLQAFLSVLTEDSNNLKALKISWTRCLMMM